MSPSLEESYDLSSSVQAALAAPDYEDDPHLTAPPDDTTASEFWQQISQLSLDDASPAQGTSDELSTAACFTDTATRATTPTHDMHTKILQADKVQQLKKGKNARVHTKRAKRQAQLAKDAGYGFHPRRSKVLAQIVERAVPIKTQLDTEALPSTSTGYTARPRKRDIEGEYPDTLEALLAEGYTLIKWDGITPCPLISSTGQVFAVLAGRVRDDDTWLPACLRAFDAMRDEGNKADFSFRETHHCRGDFPAINVGVTMGHGATYPTNLSTGPHTEMMSRLLANPDIIRIANFMDSTFNLWSPKLCKSYSEHLDPLFEELTYLWRIFDKCVFPTAAFNFGGNVFTKMHRDCMNAAVGWCGIIALGTFNPTESGHMVFPDLKLVVEYPPGSVIFIPSATLTHGNLPVVNGERLSFTLYCSGNLFRYVDNGFRTKSQLEREDPITYAELEEVNATRWMENLKLYSFFDDLVSEAK
ncbi:hypothetical protein H0H92_000528 [Tricholoma furcatifolium]|nr:hypothetical protein H0H92_000528 [Tricholoma furcatifolium]